MSTAPTILEAAPRERELLERCLRRASNRAALAPLLRRLGLEGRAVPLTRAERLRAGLGREGGHGVYRVGSAPLAFLAEPEREAETPEAELARALYRLTEEPFLLLSASPGYRTLSFGCQAPDGELRHARIARLHPSAADVDTLRELAAGGAEGIAVVIRWARVLDRRSIGARFFRDIRAQRDALAGAWTGLPKRLRAERDQLALLLLCRLLFLGFLQERGHLLGDRDFLASCLRRWRLHSTGTLYDVLLRPLFFGVFNTRPEARTHEASALGALPYLNGGLFEPHVLEHRYPRLSLPDEVLLRVFSDLLARYRFTARDAAEHATARESGIDPEVLGRVFEELMAAPRRGETGSFYTPPAIVDALVSRSLMHLLAARAALPEAVAARLVLAGDVLPEPTPAAAALPVLRELRVLDPACGSGAFLLGALARITRARAALEPAVPRSEIRRDVVARALHGVDVLDDAALLCALRLWLALAPGEGEAVSPLPNLDRRIRQGDALVDPLDLLGPAPGGPARSALLSADVRRAVRALVPLGRAYLGAEPAERPALLAQLREGELELARCWLDALVAVLERAVRERRAGAAYRDLWGLPTPASDAAARERARIEKRLAEATRLRAELEDSRALPFFSFLVHFAAERAGFDLVLANPPWIRAHRWPAALAGMRERFRVCREAGWPGARALMAAGGGGAQVDMALLFLERALGLLAEGGVLGMLLPAKLLRSLYASGARALLLSESSLLQLEDHGLDQHAVFDADAFTVSVIARRAPAGEAADGRARITVLNRGREPLAFELPQRDLPLVRGDLRSPWLIAPPRTAAALRAMQAAGTPIGGTAGLRLRRGVVTGANDVLVIADAEHRLGGLSRVRAQGWFRARRSGAPDAGEYAAWVETETLRPLLRGCDVKAWRWQTTQHVLWTPANDRPGSGAPVRLARYLARHRDVLARRTGGGAAAATGRLLRLSPDSLGHKVVWQDIAEDLHAVAVPERVRGSAGAPVPVIPLNTVYFVAVSGEREAGVLAALLNSLPLRTFARAIAERAKDARFRFFAWTVGMLPLPEGWRQGSLARELEAIAAAAHGAGGITPEAQAALDRLVARAFHLDAGDIAALEEFDAWLRR